MTDLDDFRIGPSDEPEARPPERERSRVGVAPLLVAGGVLVAALLVVAGYLLLRRPAPPSPKVADAPPATPVATPSPTPALVLPALDASDTLVRELAAALSRHPQLAVWLSAAHLVRTFTVVVDNLAEGASPSRHLGFLAPKTGFAVIARPGRPILDPASYARYDAFAEGFASLDAEGCARVYRLLEPLFEAAYRDLGYPQGGLRARIGLAIKLLADVPALEGDVPLRPVPRATLIYEFADPKVESLTPSQKHLLRMGPANVGRIKAKLAELTRALDAGEPH